MKDSTYFLVKYILDHAADHTWRRNANSIVLNLTGGGGIGVAVSIFDSRYRAKDGELIHSHHSDFTSRIVAGVMHQQRYLEADDVRGDTNGTFLKCLRQDFDVDYQPVTPAPVVSWLRAMPEEAYTAGQEYSILAPELHRTWPEDGTVTLRETQYKTPRAGVSVCWRPGEEPQRASGAEKSEIKVAPEAVPPMMLRDIVAKCLHTWF